MSNLFTPESDNLMDEEFYRPGGDPDIGFMTIYDLDYLLDKAETDKRHLPCINFYCFVHFSRRKRHLSVTELAHKADVDYGDLMSLESDTQFKLNSESVINLAMFFEVDPEVLLEMARLDKPYFDPTWDEKPAQFPRNVGSTMELNPIELGVVNGLESFLARKSREKHLKFAA